MGMKTDASIEAYQKALGIEPATGDRAEDLRRMSDAAFCLIKVIELEISGIRDGDGYWHGMNAMGSAACDLFHLIESYLGEGPTVAIAPDASADTNPF